MQCPPALYALLDDPALSRIEAQADEILETVGLWLIDDPESLSALADHGARVVGDRVFVSGDRLRRLIRQAPARFVWRGRVTGRDVVVGGGRPVYAPTYGTPVIALPAGQRALGTLDDYRALVRFCDQSELLDTTGFLLCIVHDRPEATRHLDMARLHLTLSDKPMMGTILSPAALREVAAEVGAGPEPGACRLLHMINTTPPLVLQENPLKCLRAASELGQGCLVSSYMMMGATSPVTIAGCLAQGLAEVMVGLALTQIWRPGVPVVGGIFGTQFSMRFMGPIFGLPESELVQVAGAQLVRRLGVPCRGDGMITGSKLNDAQAGYEGAGTLFASRSSGADLILHAVGWSEFGRSHDRTKAALDEALILGTHIPAEQRIALPAGAFRPSSARA